MSKIGFIGLGIMGKPMSKNLVKAGYEVLVSDLSEAAVADVVAAGGVAATNKEIAETCPIIITMLPNSPHVKKLVLGEGGLAEYVPAGTLIVDMTSGAPGDSKDIYAGCKEKGIRFIDAPVSGGEPMAIAGTLAIMVGGDKEDFADAEPVLKVMGSSATWVGPIGSGNTCKLTNQIIVALNIAALSEGLLLAEKAGADTQLVFEAIKGGLAGSTVMNAKTPMILADNFKPGFKINLHIKDLTNALNTAASCEAPLPFTEQALAILQKLADNGDGNSDHSAIAKYYEELGGIKFGK